MKKQVFLVLVLYYIFSGDILSQSVLWSSHLGSNYIDNSYGQPISSGEYLIFGHFAGNDLFSSAQTLHSTGIGDMFLMKFDISGNIVWEKQLFCSNQTMNCRTSSGAICVDEANACFYISGNFCGDINVDSFHLSSYDAVDGFIAKFDLNGNCIWIKRIAGSGTVEGVIGMTLDANGNVYMTGPNSQNLSFDSCSVINGSYILSVDPNGNCIWFKDISTYCTLPGFQIGRIIYANNKLILTGRVMNLDTIQIDTITLTHIGLNSSVIACFDLNGNVIWAKELKYPRNNLIQLQPGIEANATDIDDNIYLSGYFFDTLIYEQNVFLPELDTVAPFSNDMYLMKLNSMGNLIRFQSFHSTSRITDISVLYDILYMTGTLHDTILFDNSPIIPSSGSEFFIAKFDTAGNFNSAFHTGDCLYSYVDQDVQGSIYVNLAFENSLQIGNQSYSSIGFWDIAIFKFNSIDFVPNNNKQSDEDLVIYTNPSKGQCKVRIPESFKNKKQLILSVYNETGEMIYQNNFNADNPEISMNLVNEAKGVYMITVSDGNRICRGKIIFE